METSLATFPFHLFDTTWMEQGAEGRGQAIASLRHLSLSPPFPWGQWLYGRLLEERLLDLRGDLIECGVAKGGMALFLARYAAGTGRRMWALDSFEGLPSPDPERDNPYFRAGDYAPRPDRGPLLQRFTAAVASAGLESVVWVVPGFFETSLTTLPADIRYAFAHVDADLYQSVRSCVEHIWPRLVEGGMLVVDDFFHHGQGPLRAAGDFFRRHDVRPLYHVSFPYSVVIVKGEVCPAGQHRALDGNHYSLQWLRQDAAFQRALAHVTKAASPGRSSENAALLTRLLEPGRPDRSSDMYDYWRALEDYWDDMDADQPMSRKCLEI